MPSQRPPSKDSENPIPWVPRPPSLAHADQPSETSSKAKWMGLLLIAAGLVVIYLLWGEEERSPLLAKERVVASTDVSDQKVRRRLEGQVNRHIQMTNREIEIEKEKIKVESFMVPRVGDFIVDPSGPAQSFNHRGDQAEMNAVRDLRRNERQVPMSANDIIQSEIANQQANVEIDEAYREEYVRQFKENARRNGYEIQLSPDLRVIGVRRIRQGASQQGYGEAYR